jgi:hypothetical protein
MKRLAQINRRIIMSQFIIGYYQQGYYNKATMEVFVKIGWLTADQYKQATGEDYVAPAA